MPDFTIYKISGGTRFRVHGTFDNQQHLRTDTHHTAAVVSGVQPAESSATTNERIEGDGVKTLKYPERRAVHYRRTHLRLCACFCCFDRRSTSII